MDETGRLKELEEEVAMTERMLQVRAALDYLIMLIEPKYRSAFEKAEKKAETPEEMMRLVELAKKHVGQKALIELLKMDNKAAKGEE